MGLGHQSAEFFQVAGLESVGGGDGAQIFGNDVAAASHDLVRHLVPPARQIFGSRVAQQLDFRTMAAQNRGSLFHFCTAVAIFATGDGVLHHGIGDDQANVVGNGGEAELERAAVEQQSVVFGAVRSDELVHDAAGTANVNVLGALAEQRNFAAGNVATGEVQGGRGGGDLEGGRRAEAGGYRDIAPQAHAEGRDFDSGFAEAPNDAERVVGPVV